MSRNRPLARVCKPLREVWRVQGHKEGASSGWPAPGVLFALRGADDDEPAKPLEAPLPVHHRDTAPTDPQTWTCAVGLYRQGDYRSAAVAFDLLARVGPRRQEALVAQASALMRLGRFRWAIDLLQRALRCDPSDPVASMNLATAQYRAGLLLEAFTQACASVELFRMAGMSMARPRHLQGLVHLETGRIDRARRVLTDALAAEPTFVPALLALGQCAKAQGDFREAERCLRRARRLLRRASDDVRGASAAAVEGLARELAGGASRRVPAWVRRIGRLGRLGRRSRVPPSTGPAGEAPEE